MPENSKYNTKMQIWNKRKRERRRCRRLCLRTLSLVSWTAVSAPVVATTTKLRHFSNSTRRSSRAVSGNCAEIGISQKIHRFSNVGATRRAKCARSQTLGSPRRAKCARSQFVGAPRRTQCARSQRLNSPLRRSPRVPQIGRSECCWHSEGSTSIRNDFCFCKTMQILHCLSCVKSCKSWKCCKMNTF